MGNLGFFECKCMPFGLCNAPAIFQRLIQNCIGELNLTNLLNVSGWHDMSFWRWRQEDLQCLCIVFNCFREHNLRLKAIKCEVLLEQDQLSGSSCLQGGCVAQQRESKSCGWVWSAPNLHMEIWTFLGLVGHYWQFIKGIAHIVHNHCMNIYLGKVPVRRMSK